MVSCAMACSINLLTLSSFTGANGRRLGQLSEDQVKIRCQQGISFMKASNMTLCLMWMWQTACLPSSCLSTRATIPILLLTSEINCLPLKIELSSCMAEMLGVTGPDCVWYIWCRDRWLKVVMHAGTMPSWQPMQKQLVHASVSADSLRRMNYPQATGNRLWSSSCRKQQVR